MIWDANVHEDILISLFQHIKPSSEDWSNVMRDLQEKGYSFTEGALRYDFTLKHWAGCLLLLAGCLVALRFFPPACIPLFSSFLFPLFTLSPHLFRLVLIFHTSSSVLAHSPFISLNPFSSSSIHLQTPSITHHLYQPPHTFLCFPLSDSSCLPSLAVDGMLLPTRIFSFPFWKR